jgi:hypothetical protein
MSDVLIKNWQRLQSRKEMIGDYVVAGIQYRQDASGETGWHITTWGSHRPVHGFWVSADHAFHSMRIHYAYNKANNTLIEIFGEITQTSEDQERQSVLQGIAKWEEPAAQQTDSGEGE